MKKKKIFIAVLAAAVLALAPARSHAQIDIEPVGGTWSGLTNSGSGDNINGSSGSWGSFTNSGSGDNINGSSGSWGNFNNENPYAPLGSGLALFTMAGFGYACAKRRKAKAS